MQFTRTLRRDDLGQALTLGFRALEFSANVALHELQPNWAPEKEVGDHRPDRRAGNIVFSTGE